MRHIYLVITCACLAALISACSSDIGSRQSAKQGDPECRVVSDADSVGCPAVVRCGVVHGDPDFDLLGVWSWTVSNGKIIEHNDDWSEVWVKMNNPGACQMSARGVDKDGKDCTTPKHKIMSNKKTNVAPIVVDFGGPTFAGEGFEPGDDGTMLRYHEWRWNARAYDPEDMAKGIEVQSWSWGIYDGGDLDGDGIPDTQIGGHDENGEGYSLEPTKLKVMVRESPTRMTVRVYQYTEVDRDVQIALTVADSAAKPRKWSDGHVTLMK